MEAEAKLNRYSGLINDRDIQTVLGPIVSRDREAHKFLSDMGWKVDPSYLQSSSEPLGRGKVYDHHQFYIQTILSGMNFGPQFRVVHGAKLH